MTGLEAAEEEEAERRWQPRVAEQAENARDEHEEREIKRTAKIAGHRHRGQSQLASFEESSSLSPSSPSSSKDSSEDSSEDSDSDSDSKNNNTKDNFLNQDGGVYQSGRVRRSTRAVQLEMS